jgi:hypothetical protein
MTSSAMNSTFDASQMRFISFSTQAGYVSMPPAPRINGSTMKAAGLSPRQAASSASRVACS